MITEICSCCNGQGINKDIDGNESSCLTCNGKGNFTYKEMKKYKTITGMGNVLRKAYKLYVNIEKRYTWHKDKVQIKYYIYIEHNIICKEVSTFSELQAEVQNLLMNVQKLNKQ